MQAWMGQRCQPGKEPVISASQRETLQIQKRNAALRQEWIGNSSAGERKVRSVTDFSAGGITLEQINRMNFPAVNQKEDRLGKGHFAGRFFSSLRLGQKPQKSGGQADVPREQVSFFQ